MWILIREVNPFRDAYEVLSKNVDAPLLKAIQDYVQADRIQMTEDEAAAMLWPRINDFVRNNNRLPDQRFRRPLGKKKRMGEALIYIRNKKKRNAWQGAEYVAKRKVCALILKINSLTIFSIMTI